MISMRISEHEAKTIHSTVREFLGEGAVVRLFGSRADDSKKGGDIDLYVETSNPVSARDQLRLQYKLSSLFDMRVDLLVKSADDKDEPIFEIARKGMVL